MIAQIAENLADWLEAGELGSLSILRAVKTGFDLGAFLRDFPHDKYAIWDIIPSRTALQAVRRFQRRTRGLVVDGIVGPATAAAMRLNS